MSRHVEIFQGNDGWYRRLKSASGQNLGTDGPYTGDDNDAKHNALVGARSVHPGLPVYIIGDKGRRLVPPSDERPGEEVIELRRPFPVTHDEPEPDTGVRPSQP